jgi:hypothetical protein
MEPEHIGILWIPEPDWHFKWRMLKENSNFILDDCLSNLFGGVPFAGERLDTLGAHFGYRRLLIVDDRCGTRRQFWAIGA